MQVVALALAMITAELFEWGLVALGMILLGVAGWYTYQWWVDRR